MTLGPLYVNTWQFSNNTHSQTGKERSVPQGMDEITANYILIASDAKNNNITLLKSNV